MEKNKNNKNINNVQHGKKVHHAEVKKPVEKQKQQPHYKNLMLMLIALLLFMYAGFISVVPAVITGAFKVSEFTGKLNEATSLETSLDGFQYKIKPNLHAVIELDNLKLVWKGSQDLFEAKVIEIETKNPLPVFTKNFNIESFSVSNAHYSDQLILDEKTHQMANKLNYLLPNFNPKVFGANKIKIEPGNVSVKNYKISYITPDSYDENVIPNKIYPKTQVKQFLLEHPVGSVDIK